MTTAIIGYGWVGKAMHTLFPNSTIYDVNFDQKLYTKEAVNKCDVAFVGVPTPNMRVENPESNIPSMNGEGRLDTSIVEEVIAWCDCSLIVIRSTVNPGDCDRWTQKYGKNIVMQPEYLGETVNHPMSDQKARPFLVIGGSPKNRRKLIELYTKAYNANVTIRQVSLLEAEVIKLSENRAISYKVAECQELYDVCELAGVDYYTVRDAVYGDDPRFNLWWTMIYPEARGFRSKCIPKDVYAWCAWAESLGYDPEITRSLLGKNKEWLSGNDFSQESKTVECQHEWSANILNFNLVCTKCHKVKHEEDIR